MTKVLVVDDAVEVRRRVCSLLAEQASTVVVGCAATADEVIRHFVELGPGCVVIDVPVHDPAGFELLGALRSIDRSCVLISLTNHATEEFRLRSLGAGADHFLEKSTEFERVAELVRGLRERP
jgi:DNA-binding response OmpR family regulator